VPPVPIAEPDWDRLERLRARFIARQGSQPYWDDPADLEAYDATFGERIGWKWDAVLAELAERGWRPPDGPVLDWGCGSGVAGRRVRAAYPEITRLILVDRSPLAGADAARRARVRFPELEVEIGDRGEPIGTLLASHVVSELDDAGTAALRRAVDRAQAVLWVEPGTPDDSRALGAERDRLLGTFHPVAPCVHEGPCPMGEAGNQRDWCHHFARPPKGIHGDRLWTTFAERMGIDLRSVPYSFVALDRRAFPPLPAGPGRVIGRPRPYKGFVKILTCGTAGLAEVGLQARDHKDTIRAYDRGEGPRVLAGGVDGKGWLVRSTGTDGAKANIFRQ